MKKISLADLAKKSGYSTSTVSRTISNPNAVTKKAKEKILKIMLTSLQKEVMQVIRQWLT